MSERVLKVIASPEGDHRVLIVQREDRAYSYRRQHLVDGPEGKEWGAPGPYCGIYDSAETAEREAIARVDWPRSS
ncbi:MAG TPA: hypothetical protein VFK49_03315 [Stellaceae bacterium]|nr:hypothetical protein [Stellaceae bacterium]